MSLAFQVALKVRVDLQGLVLPLVLLVQRVLSNQEHQLLPGVRFLQACRLDPLNRVFLEVRHVLYLRVFPEGQAHRNYPADLEGRRDM